MTLASRQNEFWDRVEREMQMKQPILWRSAACMLRLGIATVLLTAIYMLIVTFVFPVQGFVFSLYEMRIHPMYEGLMGLSLIFGGAFLRFRAMGPIIERLKNTGGL